MFPYLHTLIWSVFPILFAYHQNIAQLRLSYLTVPILLSSGITLIMIFLGKALVKDDKKSSLIISFFLFFFYSYAAFKNLNNFLPDFIQSFLSGAFPLLWFVAFIAICLLILSNKVSIESKPLNVIGLVLISITLIGIIDYHYLEEHETLEFPQIELDQQLKRSDLPDIYHIIVDGYPSAETLLDVFDFDNSDFINFLEQKGFYVAEQARSHYIRTPQSVVSLFNFSYLHNLFDQAATEPYGSLLNLLNQNKVFRTLLTNNYLIAAFPTNSTITNFNSITRFKSDFDLGPNVSESFFHYMLLDTTFLSAFKTEFINITRVMIDSHADNVNYTFSSIPKLNLKDGPPTYVFAHVLVPHPPFIWDKKGNLVTDIPGGFNFQREGSNYWLSEQNIDIKKYREDFIEQLIHLNGLIMTMLSQLQENMRSNSVIIIQSDHGSASGLKWNSPEKSDIFERTSILNAFYFPNQDYSSLSKDLSLVNTFRVVFNKYFGTDLEILPNRFFFTTIRGDYDYIDTEVTETIERGREEFYETYEPWWKGKDQSGLKR